MKAVWKAPVLGVLLALLTSCSGSQAARSSQPESVTVYFSPNGGCTEAVVQNLNQATNSVYVQAYSFTSAPIAKALVEAHRRGVKVQIILDKSQQTERYSSADFVRDMGIPTFIDAQHAIAHNKVMVIDERVVLTGSFNFTKSAESNNAENLLVIRDRVLAQQYLQNWKTHAAHSQAYRSRLERGETGSPKKSKERRRQLPDSSGGVGEGE